MRRRRGEGGDKEIKGRTKTIRMWQWQMVMCDLYGVLGEALPVGLDQRVVHRLPQ